MMMLTFFLLLSAPWCTGMLKYLQIDHAAMQIQATKSRALLQQTDTENSGLGKFLTMLRETVSQVRNSGIILGFQLIFLFLKKLSTAKS